MHRDFINLSATRLRVEAFRGETHRWHPSVVVLSHGTGFESPYHYHTSGKHYVVRGATVHRNRGARLSGDRLHLKRR